MNPLLCTSWFDNHAYASEQQVRGTTRTMEMIAASSAILLISNGVVRSKTRFHSLCSCSSTILASASALTLPPHALSSSVMPFGSARPWEDACADAPSAVDTSVAVFPSSAAVDALNKPDDRPVGSCSLAIDSADVEVRRYGVPSAWR